MQNVVDDYVRTTPEDADRCAIRLRTVGKCLANKKKTLNVYETIYYCQRK